MKLIEKLAKDVTNAAKRISETANDCCNRSDGYREKIESLITNALRERYLAGFRKALEMAVTESTRYSSEGKDLGPLAYRLARLGEEEV